MIVQTSRSFAALRMTLYNITPCAVILNVVKNLLNDNTLSTLSMVGFEEIATSGDALLAMTYTLTLSF